VRLDLAVERGAALAASAARARLDRVLEQARVRRDGTRRDLERVVAGAAVRGAEASAEREVAAQEELEPSLAAGRAKAFSA
jgi:hypothetical protein